MPLKRVVDTFTPLGRAWQKAPYIVRARMRDALRKGAVRIMQTSRKMAPYRHGVLEKAHQLRVKSVSADNYEVEIFVGGIFAYPGRGSVDVTTYALEMHERSYSLGPASAKKQAGQKEKVGRKYLERALDEHINQLVRQLLDIAYKEIS